MFTDGKCSAVTFPVATHGLFPVLSAASPKCCPKAVRGKKGKAPSSAPSLLIYYSSAAPFPHLLIDPSVTMFRRNWISQPQGQRQNHFLGQHLNEVGCSPPSVPSSRASHLPFLLGKRSRFLAARYHQVPWVHQGLAMAAAKKGKGCKCRHLLTSSPLWPWSGLQARQQAGLLRAIAVSPGCCPAVLEGWVSRGSWELHRPGFASAGLRGCPRCVLLQATTCCADTWCQPWSVYKCIFSSAATETRFMAKFWMRLLWWVNWLGTLTDIFDH